MTLKLQRQTRKPSVDSESLSTPGSCGLMEHKELCPAYYNRVRRSEISLSVSRKRQPVFTILTTTKNLEKSCFKLRVQCSLLLSFLALKLYSSYGWPCFFSLWREMRLQTPHIHHGRDSHPQTEDQGKKGVWMKEKWSKGRAKHTHTHNTNTHSHTHTHTYTRLLTHTHTSTRGAAPPGSCGQPPVRFGRLC